MTSSALREAVRRSRDGEAREVFERRVAEQADAVREAIQAGEFDNECYTVGFELEAYAVDESGKLARIPEAVFEADACSVELGLHNVELNTAPDALDGAGLAEQARSIRDDVTAASDALAAHGLELVLDAMWTIPPSAGTREYLGAVEDVDGVTVAQNMRRSPRYTAIDNDVLAEAGGSIDLELPGVSVSFPTILAESLTSSVQPHLQVPDTETFARHYRYGIRTLGPVLALTTNSPFLPADCYGDVEDPVSVVKDATHESRIPVFEQSINGSTEPGDGKVRFPGDIETATDVVDRLEDDRTCAPFLREWVTDEEALSYTDTIWELDHKRGTYWRWLRAVIGGRPLEGVTDQSLRIEYRPIPNQPSVPDVVAVQALVSGLIPGLVEHDHPLEELSWSEARACFYDVVENGFDAELAWITAEGKRTTDVDVVYADLFAQARTGLTAQGVPAAEAEQLLGPLVARWQARRAPSDWKKAAVRAGLEAGQSLPNAIESMQGTYIELSGQGRPVATWETPA